MRRIVVCILAFAALSASRADAQSVDERIAALGERAPTGALLSVQYLLDVSQRLRARELDERADAWRARGLRYLQSLEEGVDPYPLERGKIVNRGYRSVISPELQGYAVYVPPDYDPSRRYPLYLCLHGGSSNGNLFLGVVLGNNLDWLSYNEHLYDDFEARWTPDWIVVAPTGFGQVMWRWMGEQDVLDVLADVQRNYAIDDERIVLAGVSNGGVGTYTIGMRHAWRFSQIQAMAGAPSWLQYLGNRMTATERREAERFSGIHLAQNSVNTVFRYYHGRTDTGPMRPHYVEEFTRHLQSLGDVPVNETWYDAGHDILYRVTRHGRVYDRLADVRRPTSPEAVRLVTGDYRANRQHWLQMDRIEAYPQLAEARARVADGRLTITTEHATALSLYVTDLPEADPIAIEVDGREVYSGSRAALGHRLHLRRDAEGWALGFPPDGRIKRPGLSGPITDAYYGRMVHVYGTQRAEDTDDLRDAAERGARGWPLWAWNVGQEVVADTAVTEAMMKSAHVVLYGTPGSNAVLERIAGALPIRVEPDAVVVGTERHEGRHVGVRFVYPNPLAPNRYVIVQAGTSTSIVKKGNKLPEFVGDWIVYDPQTVRGQQRRVQGPNRTLGEGHFDDAWRLPGTPEASTEGAGPDQTAGETGSETADASEEEPTLPIPVAPPVPTPPRRYGAPANDPAGRVARRIWARVPTFINFRAEIPGAVWRIDNDARWSIRPQQECYDALSETSVPFRPRPEISPIVASPVEILGPVDGVWFRMTHEERPLVMSCEMAIRLPALIAILKEHDVHGVEILSSYRTTPMTSFHTMGLALDLSRFWTENGWLSVLHHYEETPMQETCSGPRPRNRRARTLRTMACQMAQTRLLSSVLTPNYNEGHRDHFHIDARPDDTRIFVR